MTAEKDTPLSTDDLIAVGDMVMLPSRFGPDHPFHEVDRTPGRVKSINADGWAMVDRGRWGCFGCHVDELEPAPPQVLAGEQGRCWDPRDDEPAEETSR